MKRLMGWAVTGGLLLAVALLVVVSWVFLSSEQRMTRPYDVPARQLEVPIPADQVERGAHIARTWGCLDCHGDDLSGSVVIDAPPILVSAPNLTTGQGGVVENYSNRDWVRSIRHGVGADGYPLIFMPSHEYWVMSDADLGALLAYLTAAAPVDASRPPSVVRGLGRFLFVTGRLPLVPAEQIDHEAPRPTAPVPGATVGYGAYLSTGCTGCHGADLAGGPIPGAPPDWPAASNLTQNPIDGLGAWSRDDFVRALREGKRPNGEDLDPVMPWRNTAAMTDLEIEAIWRYFQTITPVADVTEDPTD